MLPRILLAPLLASPALAASQATDGGFRAGDLYLYNPAFEGISSKGGAVAHIETSTGTVTMIVDLEVSTSLGGQIAYDPWRDRLVFQGGLVLGQREVWLCDAEGKTELLPLALGTSAKVGRLTPRGDGVVYFVANDEPTLIRYFDAQDQVHTLMDGSGSAPHLFPGFANHIDRLHYDPASGALLAATSAPPSVCPGGTTGATSLYRLDLSSDGSRVVAESCFQYDLDPGASAEGAVGLAAGPYGDVLMTIDDNTNSTLPRMALVDIQSGTATPFASNGYLYAAATNAGCYSHVLDKAVILDTGTDVLRAFDFGEVGGGTVLATGVSSSGATGEKATLIEIGPLRSNFGLAAAPGELSVSAGGKQTFLIDMGLDYAAQPYLVLGSLSGWTGGFAIDGVDVPLVFDAYTLLTLESPNTLLHVDTFGFLGTSGRADAQLRLQAGLAPGLVGLTAYHAAVILSATAVAAATNPVPVVFAP